jgi:DNA polymerase III epsilon subunit-like protein
MIVLDIEASGLDTGKCGIWQIGALEYENQENQFLEEAKLDNEDEVWEEALVLTEKTEQDLRDKNKQTQKQLIENFLNWAKTCEEKTIAGHNVGWDIAFIQNKIFKYGLREIYKKIIGPRTIDLHTIASLEYLKERGEFDTKNGKSSMNLKVILEFCGLNDKRKIMQDGEVIEEGEAHDALDDVKLETECLNKLLRKYEK